MHIDITYFLQSRFTLSGFLLFLVAAAFFYFLHQLSVFYLQPISSAGMLDASHLISVNAHCVHIAPIFFRAVRTRIHAVKIISACKTYLHGPGQENFSLVLPNNLPSDLIRLQVAMPIFFRL